MKRATALIATLLALVVVSLPTVASAAVLKVRGPVLTTVVAERCDDAIEVRPDTTGGVADSGRTTAFEVLGIAEACAGQLLTVVAFSATGTLLGEGSVAGSAVTGATVKVTLTPVDPRGVLLSDVAGVAATLGTWGVPARWTYTPPVLPASSCAVWDQVTGVVVPGVVCTIRATSMPWGNEWSRTLQLYLRLSADKKLTKDEYFRFTFTGPTQDVPSWWSWSRADISAINFGSDGGGVTSRCSELPVLSGRAPMSWTTNRSSVDLYLSLDQGGPRGICGTD